LNVITPHKLQNNLTHTLSPANATNTHTATAPRPCGHSDQKPVHRTAAPPAPVILKPNVDYDPKESATWKLLAETDVNAFPKEKLELLTKPVIDPEMDPHDPIFSDIYTSPKVSPAERIAKSPYKGVSPKPGTPDRTLSPRESPKPGVGGGSNPGDSNGSLGAVQAAPLGSQPNSRGASRGRSPNPKGELPGFETNSIGGTKRIAQSSTFNKVMYNLMHHQN